MRAMKVGFGFRMLVLVCVAGAALRGDARAACQAGSAATAPAVTPKGVGATPPKLTSVEWVRGSAVRQWQRGTTYLLHFWAPWSGDCLRSMDCVEALARLHAGARVQLIGVTVQPQPGTVPVETFLAQRKGLAGALDYPVARDKVDATLEAWQQIISLPGVPQTVIIDKLGRIAWVGHPHEGLAEALAAILANDAKALAAVVAERERIRAGAKPHIEQISKDARAEKWKRVPDDVDALLALDARRYAPWARTKYLALVALGPPDAAAAWGRQLVDVACHDDMETLNEVAWSIVGTESRLPAEQRDLQLALAAARRANELSLGKDAGVLDTLGHAHAALGNLQQAIDLETRAVEAAFSGDMRQQLEKQRAAWEAQARAPKPATAAPVPTAPPADPPPSPPPDKPAR